MDNSALAEPHTGAGVMMRPIHILRTLTDTPFGLRCFSSAWTHAPVLLMNEDRLAIQAI